MDLFWTTSTQFAANSEPTLGQLWGDLGIFGPTFGLLSILKQFLVSSRSPNGLPGAGATLGPGGLVKVGGFRLTDRFRIIIVPSRSAQGIFMIDRLQPACGWSIEDNIRAWSGWTESMCL